MTKWLDANEIKADSEFRSSNQSIKTEGIDKADKVILKKLKTSQQSLMLEKELRKAAEKRNSDLGDEVKRLREENSRLSEDLALSYMNPPKGKAIVDCDMLESIEATFMKFNSFLDALKNLGVTNTEALQQVDKQKLQEIVDSTI